MVHNVTGEKSEKQETSAKISLLLKRSHLSHLFLCLTEQTQFSIRGHLGERASASAQISLAVIREPIFKTCMYSHLADKQNVEKYDSMDRLCDSGRKINVSSSLKFA